MKQQWSQDLTIAGVGAAAYFVAIGLLAAFTVNLSGYVYQLHLADIILAAVIFPILSLLFEKLDVQRLPRLALFRWLSFAVLLFLFNHLLDIIWDGGLITAGLSRLVLVWGILPVAIGTLYVVAWMSGELLVDLAEPAAKTRGTKPARRKKRA